MASQSLFLADVDYIQSDPPIMEVLRTSSYRGDHPGELHFSTCGFSPLASILLIVLGVLMIVVLVIVAMTRFQTGMPVAGNCSAAISAACHGPVKGESGASEMKVQWGEVLIEGADGSVRRRCAFSHGEMSKPFARFTGAASGAGGMSSILANFRKIEKFEVRTRSYGYSRRKRTGLQKLISYILHQIPRPEDSLANYDSLRLM